MGHVRCGRRYVLLRVVEPDPSGTHVPVPVRRPLCITPHFMGSTHLVFRPMYRHRIPLENFVPAGFPVGEYFACTARGYENPIDGLPDSLHIDPKRAAAS